MVRVIKFILLSSIFFTLISCSKTPYTNRNQLIMFSPQQEMQMGYQSSREILKKEKISKDPKLNSMVQRVGKKIADAAKRDDYQWEFYVIDKDILNAFCLPGGKIFVYTGLFKAVENEDQLAVVMAHEVAHALARHGAERVSMIQLSQIGQILGSAALQGSKYEALFNSAYGLTTQLGLILPYSRTFEYESDEIGLYLMTKAGYDPNEAIKFWQNMQKLKSGANPPTFLSTHPADNDRIARLKKLIPIALKHYR